MARQLFALGSLLAAKRWIAVTSAVGWSMLKGQGPHQVPTGSTFAPRRVPGMDRDSPTEAQRRCRVSPQGLGTEWVRHPRLGSSRPRWRTEDEEAHRRSRGPEASSRVRTEACLRAPRTRSGSSLGPGVVVTLRDKARATLEWARHHASVSGSAFDIFTGTKTGEGPTLDRGDGDSSGILWEPNSRSVPTQFRPRRSRGGASPPAWRTESRRADDADSSRNSVGTAPDPRQRQPGRAVPAVQRCPGPP